MHVDANLLIFPTLDAANIALNLLNTSAGEGMPVGPILLGATKPLRPARIRCYRIPKLEPILETT
jgi:phosphotransacetylase